MGIMADDVVKVMSRHMSSDYSFRGVHPFNELEDIDAVAETVWKPLFGAFTQMQRRQDIFMAGPNEIDGDEWVISMGNFMGLFDDDWLGIPSSGKIAFVPYVDFHRIRDGKICESAFFCDILRLMRQVGLTPLPIQTGAEFVNHEIEVWEKMIVALDQRQLRPTHLRGRKPDRD